LADRMKKKRSRAAGCVQYACIEGVRNHFCHHRFGEPVRSVVLTKPFAGLDADHGLIEDLKHILLDGTPVKASQTARKRSDEFLSAMNFDHPVEKIGFHNTPDTAFIKFAAREE